MQGPEEERDASHSSFASDKPSPSALFSCRPGVSNLSSPEGQQQQGLEGDGAEQWQRCHSKPGHKQRGSSRKLRRVEKNRRKWKKVLVKEEKSGSSQTSSLFPDLLVPPISNSFKTGLGVELRGRVLAQHSWSPVFHSQNCKKQLVKL